MGAQPIPDPALVVLIGPSAAGKSTWARATYRAEEIVSSDALRAALGSGEHDLDASADAFDLLDRIAAARAGRGLTVVIDTLGLDARRRRGYLELARRTGLPAVAVLFDTDRAECRRRNQQRDRPVPAGVLDQQLRRMHAAADEVAAEGWDVVAHRSAGAGVEPAHSPGTVAAVSAQQRRPEQVEFVLQVSRFPSDTADLAGWLRSVALAAHEVGLHGLALMDHLIQIPQVGRAWEPIPEPWVTLGLLAGLPTTLRLGTLVSSVTFRRPGVLAKSAATLDALTGGRAFVGLGAGWWQREHDAFGLPFPPARQRLDELEAAIETLRALWAPGTKPHHGPRVALPETTCYPRPVGAIPIIVGGSGPRRTLRIAAASADACNLPSGIEALERSVAVLRAHCAVVGRDPAAVEITVLDVPVLGRDRAHAASIVERLRGRTAAAAFARRHHAGTATDHIGRYRLLAERGVRTVFVALPDLAGPDDLERLAPVLAAFR